MWHIFTSSRELKIWMQGENFRQFRVEARIPNFSWMKLFFHFSDDLMYFTNFYLILGCLALWTFKNPILLFRWRANEKNNVEWQDTKTLISPVEEDKTKGGKRQKLPKNIKIS